jgi:hypothetical protein
LFTNKEAVTNLQDFNRDVVSESRIWHEDHEPTNTCDTVTSSTQFFDVDFAPLSFLQGRTVCSIIHLIHTSFAFGQLQQEEECAGNRSKNDSRLSFS